MTEEFTPLGGVDDIEANTTEFLESHGVEGFLVVYYRQLFFRFVKQELQSSDERTDDVSIQMHYDSHGDEVVQNKREQMKLRCEDWARKIVGDLKEDEVVGEVIDSNELERLADEDVGKRLMNQFHDTVEDWKAEELLDDDAPVS